jgi:hypothetical protein
MALPVQITTHVVDTLALLIARYSKAAVVTGMVKSLSTEVQALEDAAWAVINAVQLVNHPMGGGPWDILDKLAALVGVPGGRLGRADIDLLQAIKVQIRINHSRGLVEDIIAITALVAPTAATYSEDYPASFTEQLLGTTQPIANALIRYLGKARSAGTRGYLTYTLAPSVALILDSSRVALASATALDSARTPGTFPNVMASLRVL